MVSPRGCGGAILYVVVTDFPGHPSEGIDEWVVKVPMKTGLMASCKTNNYLLNALTAMESQVPPPLPRFPLAPLLIISKRVNGFCSRHRKSVPPSAAVVSHARTLSFVCRLNFNTAPASFPNSSPPPPTALFVRTCTTDLAQDKGGVEGIWINDMGNVAETCMGNVAIVDKEGVLRSPPYDGSILAGTTMLRAFALAPQLVQVAIDGAMR